MTVTYVTQHMLWVFLENLPHCFCNNALFKKILSFLFLQVRKMWLKDSNLSKFFKLVNDKS